MTDEELMLAYAGGADASFREIFQRYAPLLLRVLQRYVGRQVDAQDLVQQTFLQLHRARQDFREGTRFRPWVMTIALNLARDLFRRRGRRPEIAVEESMLPPSSICPPDGGDQAELSARVRAALGELPADQREVIVLHWFEELSFKEIAEIVGTSSGAARIRAHRGYQVLRRVLEVTPDGTATPRREARAG